MCSPRYTKLFDRTERKNNMETQSFFLGGKSFIQFF
jgi:hypothetical protein